MHVLRQLRVDDLGFVVYGTSARPLVDATSGVSLPVFDRLAVYRLEPTSIRSLARSLERLEIAEWVPPARAGQGPVGQSIAWTAFGRSNVLVSAGRPRGRFAEVLSQVAAYLPPGETLAAPLSRPVVPVLRGVPEPREDAEGALAALRALLVERPEDPVLLLNAFALACRLGYRSVAEPLLERWGVAAADASSAFGDDPGAPRGREVTTLRRLLPRQPEAASPAVGSDARRKTS